MHKEHCFSRFRKCYVYLVLYTKKMFFVQCYFLFISFFQKARNIGPSEHRIPTPPRGSLKILSPPSLLIYFLISKVFTKFGFAFYFILNFLKIFPPPRILSEIFSFLGGRASLEIARAKKKEGKSF